MMDATLLLSLPPSLSSFFVFYDDYRSTACQHKNRCCLSAFFLSNRSFLLSCSLFLIFFFFPCMKIYDIVMGANIERPMFIDLVPVKKKKGRRRRRRRRRRDEDEEARKKKTHNIYARAFFSSPMSIFVNDRTAHLPSRALINCMYAQYLCRWQWYTCCLYMRRTCWLVKKSIANAIVKRNSLSPSLPSFLLLSTSAVSRYSKQLRLRYSATLQLPILSTTQ